MRMPGMASGFSLKSLRIGLVDAWFANEGAKKILHKCFRQILGDHHHAGAAVVLVWPCGKPLRCMKYVLHTMKDQRSLGIIRQLDNGFHAQQSLGMGGAQKVNEHLDSRRLDRAVVNDRKRADALIMAVYIVMMVVAMVLVLVLVLVAVFMVVMGVIFFTQPAAYICMFAGRVIKAILENGRCQVSLVICIQNRGTRIKRLQTLHQLLELFQGRRVFFLR